MIAEKQKHDIHGFLRGSNGSSLLAESVSLPNASIRSAQWIGAASFHFGDVGPSSLSRVSWFCQSETTASKCGGWRPGTAPRFSV